MADDKDFSTKSPPPWEGSGGGVWGMVVSSSDMPNRSPDFSPMELDGEEEEDVETRTVR